MKSYTGYSSWIKRWTNFFHERFPLYFAIPIIAFFVLGNEAVAIQSMNSHFHPFRTLIAFLMCLSFFYRLVIFSDLNEYENDCQWHPNKPMPRGLVSVKEGTLAAFSLIILEMALTAIVGIHSFLAHLLPISWSLLMWHRFFIPKWLVRHPVVNLLLRAPVLALCGYSVGVTSLEVSLNDFPFAYFIFGVANWAIFCLFSISRHTCYRYEAVNFKYILGRYGDYGLMVFFAVTAAFIGMDIWLTIGLIPVITMGYLWAVRSTSRMTKFLHEVNFGFILYFYIVLSLSLVID